MSLYKPSLSANNYFSSTKKPALLPSLLHTNEWHVTFSVGKPISVQKDPNPSREMVDEIHSQYSEALSNLFDDHKENYGVDPNVRLNFIWSIDNPPWYCVWLLWGVFLWWQFMLTGFKCIMSPIYYKFTKPSPLPLLSIMVILFLFIFSFFLLHLFCLHLI